jgi:Flp pilus assembly protein TadG
MVEFAIILPILLLLVGGIIQYGAIFATKHSLIQVGRDAGRWAATQSFNPCRSAVTQSQPQPVTEANALAWDYTNSRAVILGYTPGAWNNSTFVSYPDNSALPANPPNTEGVEVVWSYSSGTCPPADSTTQAYVTIRLSHRAPIFLPGLQFLPSLGSCDSSGCYLAITTTAEFRMEPHP